MKCERCNKEHDCTYGSGRFCSTSCANSRGPRSKEVKEKISKKLIKKYYCSSCNVQIYKRTKKYCIKCGDLYKYRILFNKLNVLSENLLESNKKAIELLYVEYFINKNSKPIIMEKYNIQSNTIYNFLKKNNITLRNLSEATSLAILNNRSIVPSNNVYQSGYHITWNNKKVYYRSSYELEYCKYLDKNKINYEVESLRIKYFDTQLNKERIAIPDFYLPESNTIVEIKSSWTLDEQNMKDKEIEYLKRGYKFILKVGNNN
jgi:hypothetical protein